MKLIVVRHGETRENAKHILMGQRQGTLSAKGKAQANKLALKLKNAKIDVIFSSDLKRARDTTKEIAQYHKIPIIYTKALREQNYGVFQGRALGELMATQKGKRNPASKPKGGESMVEVRNRVQKFMDKLDKKYAKKIILISAHAGVVMSTFSIYGNVPLRESVKMKPRNTGVLVIDVVGRHLTAIRDDIFN